MENRVPYGGSFINRTKVIALVLFLWALEDRKSHRNRRGVDGSEIYWLSKVVKALEIEGSR